MATANELLTRTAKDLNDYFEGDPNKQFQRWDIGQLLSYWNEALCLMYSFNPSKFKCVRVAKLSYGINTVICDCKKVLSIIGVSDKDGNVLYEIEPDKKDKTLKWGGFRPNNCPKYEHTRDFKLKNYKIESDKDGSIFVNPPIPYGKDVYIKYMCETPPEPMDMNNLNSNVGGDDCSHIAIGIHWALFRALMVDEESQSSVVLADKHLQLFLKLNEVKGTVDKESDYDLSGIPADLKKYVAREIAKYKLGAR